MTKNDWLNQVKENQEKLEYLLDNWHPLNIKKYGDMTITAPNAERACEVIRNQIINSSPVGHPTVRFKRAIELNDVDTIITLLNDAWFGCPESTDCWQIKGFREAVRLLEDMPE